jgi:seryl-tRNA synthetase
MEYYCTICDKKYKNYKSLWKHNYVFHKKLSPKEEDTVIPMSPKNIENEFKCIICKKEYKYRQGLWKHNKVCKGINNEKIDLVMKENLEMKKEMLEYKKELENLKTQLQKSLKIHPKTLQKINNQLNNNTNNGTINNNTINIIQLGKEDLSKMLSVDEKMSILNRQVMGINDLVKLVHTSGKYKKCMNVYITNLQNTIGYMYDEKQNNFIAVNKNELLNDLLDSRMYDIEKFYDKLQLKLEPEKAARIKKFISRMKDDEDCLKDLKKY